MPRYLLRNLMRTFLESFVNEIFFILLFRFLPLCLSFDRLITICIHLFEYFLNESRNVLLCILMILYKCRFFSVIICTNIFSSTSSPLSPSDLYCVQVLCLKAPCWCLGSVHFLHLTFILLLD